MENTYVLIDLERTVGSGKTYYWRPNKRGYTTDPEEAGRYSDKESTAIVSRDIDQLTVRMTVKTLERLLTI